MKRFGKKLRKLREKSGLTYRQLAAEVGCSHVQLIRLERGEQKPSAELAFNIARYFNITADQSLDDEQDVN